MENKKGILSKHALPELHSNATWQIKQVYEDTYCIITWDTLWTVFFISFICSVLKHKTLWNSNKEWHINSHHDWEQ